MEPNTSLENKIWLEGVASQDEESLDEILRYLANRLAHRFDHSVEIPSVQPEAEIGGACPVFLRQALPSEFNTEWDGMIHVRVPEDFESQTAQIYATMLGYFNNKRIGLQEHDGQSMLFLTYEKHSDSSVGAWQKLEWKRDDYGEWESYKLPAWIRDLRAN